MDAETTEVADADKEEDNGEEGEEKKMGSMGEAAEALTNPTHRSTHPHPHLFQHVPLHMQCN